MTMSLSLADVARLGTGEGNRALNKFVTHSTLYDYNKDFDTMTNELEEWLAERKFKGKVVSTMSLHIEGHEEYSIKVKYQHFEYEVTLNHNGCVQNQIVFKDPKDANIIADDIVSLLKKKIQPHTKCLICGDRTITPSAYCLEHTLQKFFFNVPKETTPFDLIAGYLHYDHGLPNGIERSILYQIELGIRLYEDGIENFRITMDPPDNISDQLIIKCIGRSHEDSCEFIHAYIYKNIQYDGRMQRVLIHGIPSPNVENVRKIVLEYLSGPGKCVTCGTRFINRNRPDCTECLECTLYQFIDYYIKVNHSDGPFHICTCEHGLGLLTQLSKRFQVDINRFILRMQDGTKITPEMHTLGFLQGSILNLEVL